MKEIIYGTENGAKVAHMERALKGVPIKITGVKQVASKRGLVLPKIEETGDTPLENARLKAEGIFRLFKLPCFPVIAGCIYGIM